MRQCGEIVPERRCGVEDVTSLDVLISIGLYSSAERTVAEEYLQGCPPLDMETQHCHLQTLPGEPGNEINSNKLQKNKNKKPHPNISCFTYDYNTALVSIHSYPARQLACGQRVGMSLLGDPEMAANSGLKLGGTWESYPVWWQTQHAYIPGA